MIPDDSSPGRRMVEAFHYVRDVSVNVASLLASADILLDRRGFRRYGGSSGVTLYQEDTPKVSNPDTWLWERAIRQYYREGRENAEVLTLTAALWDRAWPDMPEPLCIASYMEVTGPRLENMYWIGPSPLWRRQGIEVDGEIHGLGVTDLVLDERDASRFAALVKGDRLVYVASPLLAITDLDALERRLVVPLVGALKG